MIARRAGTLVSLGMLFGVVAGCGTQLDPRLQPNAELRADCEYEGNSYSEAEIRGILGEMEERRLSGYPKAAAYDAGDLKCAELYPDPFDDRRFWCNRCHTECVNQIYPNLSDL